jgi:ribosome modulation factor
MQTKPTFQTDAEERAYEAGFDAGTNGPNMTNCHFSHFAERSRTTAWERGKADSGLVSRSAVHRKGRR